MDQPSSLVQKGETYPLNKPPKMTKMTIFFIPLNAYRDIHVDPPMTPTVMTTYFIRLEINIGYMTLCIKFLNSLWTLLNSWFTMRLLR